MMVVMPSLSKSQQSHYPLVSALIVGFELTLAKCMAHRIDAPSYVVCEEYAYESPQSKPVHPPIANGMTSESTTQRKKVRLTKTTSGSATRLRQYT